MMCDNEFETKEKKNCTKGKISPQHIHVVSCLLKKIMYEVNCVSPGLIINNI